MIQESMHWRTTKVGGGGRCAVVVALLLSVVMQSEAQAEADLVIDIPAPNGSVTWDEVGARLATELRLDGDVVRGLLPRGQVRLNSTTTQLTFATIELGTRGGLGFQRAETADGGPLLRVTIDRAWSRRQRAKLERVVRATQGEERPPHGCRLFLPDHCEDRTHGRELVLLIHGYNGSEQSLESLRKRLEQAGLVCADFIYPNDGALEAAAKGLSDELHGLHRRQPDLKLAIVSHSMGGLVARRVIEDPELDPGSISRLIQVAPPNHGSNLAYLPFGLDVWEHLGPRQWANFDSQDVLTAWIADGLEEARHDVRPDSEWLAKLNARPRDPRVAYSILLGTDAPLTTDDLQKLRDSWGQLCARERTAALLRPRIDPLLQGDEWREGLGDGAVSVRSGRLEGVQDVVVLPIQHDCIRDGLDGPDGERLVEAILARLPLTVAAPEVLQVSPQK